MRRLTRALAGAAALVTAACAGTTFNSTWKNPEAKPVTLNGQTVVALVMSPNEATRRAAEETLARELNALGVKGVPAHTLLPTEQIHDRERARAAFQKADAQGAVVLQVVGRDQQLSSTPSIGVAGGRRSSSFWGWGWSWDTGGVRSDTVLSVETLVYDLKADQLIWAAESQTTNPGRTDDLIRELATESVREMKKAGLIRPAA